MITLPTVILALDKSSRRFDEDGRLHVVLTNISKANVCPYLGSEIPDADKLGLKPDRVYQLLRDPAELAKGAASFNNLPVLNEHIPVHADDHQPDAVVGSTGTDTVFDAPYLRTSLVIWAKDSIAGVQSRQQCELSSAYRYDADMTPGKHDGVPYDGVMRNIRGNHVALVETGRAGSDVVVGDSQPEEFKHMAKTVLSPRAAQAFGALSVYLRPKMAADAKINLQPMLSAVTKANWDAKKPALVTALTKATAGKLAADADIGDVLDMLDRLEDVVEQMEEAPATADDEAETEEEKKDRMEKRAADKAAKDAEMDKDDEKPAAKKAAMDAAINVAITEAKAAMRAEANAIREAERLVRPIVGEIVVTMDSADAVYKMALDAKGIDLTGVAPAAYAAMFRVLSTVAATPAPAPVAMDTVNAEAKFRQMFPTAVKLIRS